MASLGEKVETAMVFWAPPERRLYMRLLVVFYLKYQGSAPLAQMRIDPQS